MDEDMNKSVKQFKSIGDIFNTIYNLVAVSN